MATNAFVKSDGASNVQAQTMLSHLAKGNVNQLHGLPGDGERTIVTKDVLAMLEERVETDNKLSLDFMPLEICIGEANCMVQECYMGHVAFRLDST